MNLEKHVHECSEKSKSSADPKPRKLNPDRISLDSETVTIINRLLKNSDFTDFEFA